MGGGSLRKGLAWFGGCLHPCWWLIEALAVLVACHVARADPFSEEAEAAHRASSKEGLGFPATRPDVPYDL